MKIILFFSLMLLCQFSFGQFLTQPVFAHSGVRTEQIFQLKQAIEQKYSPKFPINDDAILYNTIKNQMTAFGVNDLTTYTVNAVNYEFETKIVGNIVTRDIKDALRKIDIFNKAKPYLKQIITQNSTGFSQIYISANLSTTGFTEIELRALILAN